MRFRRVLEQQRLWHEVDGGEGQWRREPKAAGVLPSPFTAEYELSLANEHRAAGGGCLPFQPVSFRDFMLFEQHNIDASRGLVKRFHPGQFRATAAIEKLTGKPFPMFKPHGLFYDQPIYYMSNHSTFVPSGTPMQVPAYSKALDFELELGFVLNAPLRDASASEAEAAIGAFVLVNDFSCRDIQRREMASGFGPQKSKHFASSMSEAAVTADEVLGRVGKLTGSVAINGKTVSTVSDAGAQWRLGDMLAHASKDETLRPGELFATGTLPGGSGMELGQWLKPGDSIELTIDGIGHVSHEIV